MLIKSIQGKVHKACSKYLQGFCTPEGWSVLIYGTGSPLSSEETLTGQIKFSILPIFFIVFLTCF